MIISRQVLADFVGLLPSLQPGLVKEVAVYALDKLQPRVVSFEEQVTVIRERLAAIFEGEEDWAQAARTLAAIPLDSGNRVLQEDYKVEKYVHIAQLYLENDEPVQAEAYINRASLIISPETEPGLRLRHKVCYARILDSKRKFLEAAVRYYQLSQVGDAEFGGAKVDEAELLKALTAAVTCAILAPAGPQRSRFLATLYKDERSAKLDVYSVLEKTFMERVLEAGEVRSFAQKLAPHQMAKLEDGARARRAARSPGRPSASPSMRVRRCRAAVAQGARCSSARSSSTTCSARASCTPTSPSCSSARSSPSPPSRCARGPRRARGMRRRGCGRAQCPPMIQTVAAELRVMSALPPTCIRTA